MLEMDDEDIMKFYEKYKNTEFLYVIILLFNIKKYGMPKIQQKPHMFDMKHI